MAIVIDTMQHLLDLCTITGHRPLNVLSEVTHLVIKGAVQD